MHRSYALFDFDGTMISGDSILLFLRYAHQQKLCTTHHLLSALWSGIRYTLRLSSATESKQAALSFLAGKPQTQLDALARDFCRDVLIPRLYPQAIQAIQTHISQGLDVLLLTASPAFYLQPLASHLGLTKIIGTRVDMGVNDLCTGLICGENCRGIQKPLRLAEYLTSTGCRLRYETSYAYGDTTHDIPMLQLCAHPVAVNANHSLRKKLHALPGIRFVRWGK